MFLGSRKFRLDILVRMFVAVGLGKVLSMGLLLLC